MPFIPVFNGVQLVIDWIEDTGATAKIILGVQFDVPAVLDTLEELVNYVIDTLASPAVRPWTTHWGINGVTAYGLDTDSSPTYTNTHGTMSVTLPILGTLGGFSATDQVAAVNTMQTGMRGRSHRGRNYWPGVPTASMSDTSTLSPALVADWDTYIDAFIAAMVANSTPLVVISRFADHAARTEGLMTHIIDCRTEAKVGTQRRRVRGTFGGA